MRLASFLGGAPHPHLFPLESDREWQRGRGDSKGPEAALLGGSPGQALRWPPVGTGCGTPPLGWGSWGHF